MMSGFEEFVTAEIREMMAAMDNDSRGDAEAFRRKAQSWVEQNAITFRQRWNEAQEVNTVQ
jgi:hypothetical protein